MPALSLTLLGPFQLCRAGRPLGGFDSAKVRALLAFLAVESGRAHSRAALAELLWPAQGEGAARHSLSQALSNLRRVLGDREADTPVLALGREAVGFDPAACAVDALALGAALSGCAAHLPHAAAGCAACAHGLEAALAGYGGGFLDGLALDDSPAFEEWAARTREGYVRMALQGLQTLGEHALARGEYERARGAARRQLELDPLHEAGHRQLMEAHARSGRRAAALRQYLRCAGALEQELGVPPADETTRLYEQIKAHGLAPSAPAAAPARDEEAQPDERPLFVARAGELAQLEALLALALGGRGQVAFVTGETGGGKTALLHELARRAALAHPDLLVAGGSCSAQAGDPYLPFRELFGVLAGDLAAGRGGSPVPTAAAVGLRAALPHVAAALVTHGPDLVGSFVSASSLLARLDQRGAGADADWRARLAELAARRAAPPALEQQRLFSQVGAVLGALAARQPLLLLLDDLQWADAASAALLFQLGRAVASAPILVVAAYRPEELAAGRAGGRHPLEPVVHELRRIYGHAALDLDQSARDEGGAFVGALLDSEPNALGPGFRAALLQQTGGHPLFIVELLRDMQARGDLVRDDAGRWREGASLDWDALPARVEGAIAERVARLDEAAREALLVAAVEGERFTAEVLARVQGAEPRSLVRLLGALDRQHRLVSAQGVRQLGGARLSSYSFRHILFQRYLYGQLDPAERAYLHEEVGAALEALHGAQADAIAAQLALQFEQAGDAPRAIGYLRRAGEQAVSLAAFDEAVGLFDRALALVATLPPGPDRDREELALQVARAVPLASTYGYAHPAVERAYARARALGHSAAPDAAHVAALWGLFTYALVRAEAGPMGELADQLRALTAAAAPELRLVGHWAQGVHQLYAGAPAAALEQLAAVGRLADPARPVPAMLFATDPGVACRFWSAWALWLTGRPDAALASSRAAVALAEALEHPFSRAYALFTGTALLQFRREPAEALRWAEATVALSAQHGFRYFHGLGTVFRGWALAEGGHADEGRALMERGIADARATGARIGLPHMLALLAELRGTRGDPAAGLALLDEALALADESGERHYEAELHRLRGELLLRLAPADPAAEASLRRALAVAQSQGAPALELRAALSLGRLLAPTARRDEGLDTLQRCVAGFAEGHATADLREALALIAELSAVRAP